MGGRVTCAACLCRNVPIAIMCSVPTVETTASSSIPKSGTNPSFSSTKRTPGRELAMHRNTKYAKDLEDWKSQVLQGLLIQICLCFFPCRAPMSAFEHVLSALSINRTLLSCWPAPHQGQLWCWNKSNYSLKGFCFAIVFYKFHTRLT